jgi:transposase InsO family protein
MTWLWYHLYVILDVFSRYVVGWKVAPRESAILAERLSPPAASGGAFAATSSRSMPIAARR